MSERILFVDDEKFVLEAFRRNLRKQFKVEVADDPLTALKMLETSGPFAVVVSDLKMPNMTGTQMLGVVKKRWPDTVRIMLTGQADLNAAMDAVNQGNIFRFLTKPCSPEDLVRAVTDGLNQYRLIMAERQLLHGTLRGCLQVMSEILGLVSPEAFGRGNQAKDLVMDLVDLLRLDGGWKYELAAMLSQIGCISLPPEILDRRISGERLSPEEEQIFLMHPAIAGNLTRNIPRLESVAEMIADQEVPLDKNPCLGGRILKVTLDFTDLTARGVSESDALVAMQKMPGVYDARVLGGLKEVLERRTSCEVRPVGIADLRDGMVLVENVVGSSGAVLMEKNQVITNTAIARFVNFGSVLGVREPLYVLVKKQDASESNSDAS